jgi:hypothetical protein
VFDYKYLGGGKMALKFWVEKFWKKNFGILGLENFERTASWFWFIMEIAPREEGGDYPTEEGRYSIRQLHLTFVIPTFLVWIFDKIDFSSS